MMRAHKERYVPAGNTGTRAAPGTTPHAVTSSVVDVLTLTHRYNVVRGRRTGSNISGAEH